MAYYILFTAQIQSVIEEFTLICVTTNIVRENRFHVYFNMIVAHIVIRAHTRPIQYLNSYWYAYVTYVHSPLVIFFLNN